MNDPRIEIPAWARSMGIFGGLIMMALGLLIGWRRSEMDVVLPPTGGPKPPAPGPSTGDRLVEALIGRISGSPPDGKS
jgi:hypothetical protein